MGSVCATVVLHVSVYLSLGAGWEIVPSTFLLLAKCLKDSPPPLALRLVNKSSYRIPQAFLNCCVYAVSQQDGFYDSISSCPLALPEWGLPVFKVLGVNPE